MFRPRRTSLLQTSAFVSRFSRVLQPIQIIADFKSHNTTCDVPRSARPRSADTIKIHERLRDVRTVPRQRKSHAKARMLE